MDVEGGPPNSCGGPVVWPCSREGEQRAVSKVVGVVLMTAIVIALAATAATMLTGFGNTLSEPPPQVAFNTDYHQNIDDPGEFHSELPENTNEVLLITHTAGDRFDPSRVELVIRHEGVEEYRASWADASTGQGQVVGAADALYPHSYGETALTERTIQLIWYDESRQSGQIVFEWEGKNIE